VLVSAKPQDNIETMSRAVGSAPPQPAAASERREILTTEQ